MAAFVHVISLVLNPAATHDFVARIRATLEAIETINMPRLFGSAILVSDDNTRVAVVSEWSDREAWAQAQWDERVQNSVVDVFQTAEHVGSQSYNEVFRFDALRG